MSFLKITDPKKRDLIVEEYLKTTKNIQKKQLVERLGEQDTLKGLQAYFKPITNTQKELTQNIISEIAPIKNVFQNHMLPIMDAEGVEGVEGAEGAEDVDYFGNVAAHYLRKFATKDADKTYGLHDKDGEFYIGDQKIEVVENNIVVGEKEYVGTPGLWELLIMKEPKVYTAEDYENYAEILTKTNVLMKDAKRPKASRGYKWKHILSRIWNERDRFEGKGAAPSALVIPSDPTALLDRFDLLMASRAAGNTGVRNELVSICDELKRQNVFSKDAYKELMLLIQNVSSKKPRI